MTAEIVKCRCGRIPKVINNGIGKAGDVRRDWVGKRIITTICCYVSHYVGEDVADWYESSTRQN